MRTNKKSFVLYVIVSIILSVSFCLSAAAADVTIRGAYIKLPDAHLEFSKNVDSSDIDSVYIEDHSLEYSEEVEDADKAVYMLVDISTSMSQQKLNALKPSLINYAKSLDDDDKFVLMTFGKQVNVVLLDEKDHGEIENAINSIQCNSPGTTFYIAINEAFEMSQSDKQLRKLAIVVSDGEDYETAEMSKGELLDVIEAHEFPVYGLCDSDSSKVSADNFGEICRTSGGIIKKFSSANATEAFSEVSDAINDVCVIKFRSDYAKKIGKSTLTATVNSQEIKATVNAKAKKKTSKPKVKSIEYDESSNGFIINFSEDIENYEDCTVTTKDEKKEIVILEKRYYENSKSSILLIADKTIYTGEYRFDLSDITDCTENQNKLKKEIITQEVEARPIIFKVLIIVGIALVPVVFLVAIYVILLMLKKKKNVTKIKEIFVTQQDVVEKQQVHIVEEKVPTKTIIFNILKTNGKLAKAEFKVHSSIFVGRDSICDLCIDDDNLSRQHFAVETCESGFSVTDLNSSNGTYVNGVPIRSKSFIRSGDKIAAGRTMFIIEY